MTSLVPKLACPFCQRPCRVTPPTFSDPIWRVYCGACEVTQILPVSAYATPQSIVVQWALLTRQRGGHLAHVRQAAIERHIRSARTLLSRTMDYDLPPALHGLIVEADSSMRFLEADVQLLEEC
jgi:hypothetical protein